MKAKEAVNAALTLLAHVNAAGVVDRGRESRYYGMAPAFLTLLQHDVGSRLNLPAPAPVTDLEQELSLDDATAERLMPAGLVMYFALIDHDSALYNHYSELYYERLVPALKPGEVFLEDYYGVRCDPTMQ